MRSDYRVNLLGVWFDVTANVDGEGEVEVERVACGGQDVTDFYAAWPGTWQVTVELDIERLAWANGGRGR